MTRTKAISMISRTNPHSYGWGFLLTKIFIIMEKLYCVEIKETSCGFVEVKAKNENDAGEKAYEAWSNGYAQMVGSVNCEILKVELA